jgi:amidase
MDVNPGPEHNAGAVDPLHAFRLRLDIREETGGAGPLGGMTFAVKDVFDVAGLVTGGGTPDWLATHAPARETAPAVAACLQAGARLIGIAIADEMAFSISGENAHYGTPVNPAAPDRVPGGSSSGSASAVAGGLVDFALGTDTAGSIRVPASYCGIFGMRPTHGRISTRGVMPLSASFDTVAWFARDAATLERVGKVLLPCSAADEPPIRRLVMLEDAFDLADAEARPALQRAAEQVADAIGPVTSIRLSRNRFREWLECFDTLRPPEIWAAHGEWFTRVQPRSGPQIAARFEAVRRAAHVDTTTARAFRAAVQAKAMQILGAESAFVLPTVPTIAPKKGLPDAAAQALRQKTFRLTCISPLLGLPEVSLPLAAADRCPIGLSLIGPPGADASLLRAIQLPPTEGESRR